MMQYSAVAEQLSILPAIFTSTSQVEEHARTQAIMDAGIAGATVSYDEARLQAMYKVIQDARAAGRSSQALYAEMQRYEEIFVGRYAQVYFAQRRRLWDLDRELERQAIAS